MTRTPAEIRAAAERNIQVSLTPAETLGIFAELERLRVNEADRRLAAQAAMEAAARIDTAASHGVPCGSEDLVTAQDWDRLLRYARCGGTERPV